ncbi:DUF1178 family protein [Rhodobacter sp. NTK016B]|uniref:DUF1178 family protein n=1 Tax=Rhodobacter sp. NTK016B TaxID=2759676 RepID=UPI001A8E603D|nr:DUF1178 family protein [Rhodobacter sp. NTK016B]MBN8293168.1 DUF1178 family protein [Rhodobacter sp. NTK016B]
MIRYSLQCDKGHAFESWFASASAYDALAKGGHLSCAHCGSPKVEKALMAPSVSSVESNSAKPVETPAATPLGPRNAIEERIAAIRKHVETTSDYVGDNFVREARAMHLGESPERPIWGEAKPEDARALVDEGIPVAPLPFMGKARTN